MQTSIFNDYLKDLNNEMKKQNRNILLLLENATSVLNSLNVEKLDDLQDLIDELAPTDPMSSSEYIKIDENDEINLQDIVSIINPPEESQNQEEIIEELPSITNKEALSSQ